MRYFVRSDGEDFWAEVEADDPEGSSRAFREWADSRKTGRLQPREVTVRSGGIDRAFEMRVETLVSYDVKLKEAP